jgi:hypothetical protein
MTAIVQAIAHATVQTAAAAKIVTSRRVVPHPPQMATWTVFQHSGPGSDDP